MLPFFTIGHSNRSFEEFAALVLQAEISTIVDVRKMPRSRSNPQFNADVIAADLSKLGINYTYMSALGGFRGRTMNVPSDVNAFWNNQSFHNYADYAMSSVFTASLRDLRQLGHASRCGIMCAEAVWWRCHRRIITDYLIASGETVFHILGLNRLEQAQVTTAAKIHPDKTLSYPSTDRTDPRWEPR